MELGLPILPSNLVFLLKDMWVWRQVGFVLRTGTTPEFNNFNEENNQPILKLLSMWIHEDGTLWGCISMFQRHQLVTSSAWLFQWLFSTCFNQIWDVDPKRKTHSFNGHRTVGFVNSDLQIVNSDVMKKAPYISISHVYRRGNHSQNYWNIVSMIACVHFDIYIYIMW